MWHLQANHRGTRNDAVAPPSHPVGNLRITLAWLLDSTRRHLKAFVKPTEAPNLGATPLKIRGHLTYTMLGLHEIDAPRRHERS